MLGFLVGENLKHLRFCQEKSDLLDALAEASKNYAKAAMKITGALLFSNHQSRREEMGLLRLESENARKALADHRREHGC